jgi:methanogenic corrinoid protein MtbC1
MGSRGVSEVVAHEGAETRSCEAGPLFESHAGSGRERLTSVILHDIVPRLHMLHHDLSVKDAERGFSRKEISDFGETLMSSDGVAVEEFLQRMRGCGHSEETLFLGLMAETARHLGSLWEDDHCSFIDVTIGVARLHKLLCEFNGAREPALTDGGRRVLLCALEGENHLFGVDMVACFMRHASWDVDLQKGIPAQAVAAAVAHDHFAILGLTLSAQLGLDLLCRAIQSARAASINPAIRVLVGGPLFLAHPRLVTQVGADAMASDAASASLLAEKLLLRQRMEQPARHHRVSHTDVPTGTAFSASGRRAASAGLAP